jgi:hypothetical protein
VARGGAGRGQGRKTKSKNKATRLIVDELGDGWTLTQACQALTPKALKAIERVMDDSRMSGSAITTAATTIIYFGHGKPTQTHKHEGEVKVQHTVTDELRAKALAAFLARTGAKLK